MANTKRSVFTWGCLVAAISLSLLSAVRSRAQISNTFTNASLNDRYGFHVIALHSNGQPFAISGYYQFNGNGNLIGKDTVSNGCQPPGCQPPSPDEITQRAYTGTYQVNADGTGTLQLDISPSFQPVGRFTIVDGGKAVEIIFAVPGNMNAFALHKQNSQ
jgi:hypothetical protein